MSNLLTKPLVQHHLSCVSPIQLRDFPLSGFSLMEGRLRGGLRHILPFFGYQICFSVCLCFSGRRGTVALKLDVMYEEHHVAAREGSIPTRLPLTSSCDPPLLFVYQVFQVNNTTGVLYFWIVLKTSSTFSVILSLLLLFQCLTEKTHVCNMYVCMCVYLLNCT